MASEIEIKARSGGMPTIVGNQKGQGMDSPEKGREVVGHCHAFIIDGLVTDHGFQVYRTMWENTILLL